jgi:hypothetical protein
VKIHVFDEEDQRPEDLDAEEIALLLA